MIHVSHNVIPMESFCNRENENDDDDYDAWSSSS